MLYKIRHYPNSVLAVTLKPKERLYINPGSLISMDGGLIISRLCGGGWLRALARFLLGKENLMVNVIHNPTDQPLSFTLGKALPGNLTRLELPKNGIFISLEYMLPIPTASIWGCIGLVSPVGGRDRVYSV
ncbi:TIGR00266 family protein [Synechocystis salina]|uniref:TIGR00266 family protein n=1 Tax=Synechocystis salina TaxID=945780 RepID=UPI002AD2C9C0|nr:TIGR00266 family protein [Synechocystis salina]